MKKIFLLIALSFAYFFNLSAQKKALENLFDQYQDTDGVTSIKIAKPMFNMLSRLNVGDSEIDQIKPLLGKIESLKILVIEDNAAASKTLSKDILSKVSNLNYEELMTVNSKEAKIKFLSSEAKDGILEDLLLNINSTGNTVLMMLDGKIAMEDVNKLVNDTQIQIDNKSSSKTSSNTRTKEERKVDNFSGINVSNGMKLFFTQGPKQSLTIETDSDKIQYLKSEVKNGTLNLYIDTKGQKNVTLNNIIVEITAPELNSLQASSGAQFISKNNINTEKLIAKLSSGASATGGINAKNINLEISSGAQSNLNVDVDKITHEGSSGSKSTYSGKSNNLIISTSSAAILDAFNLVTNNANITASSASTVKVNALEELTSTASSGAKVRYSQKPKKSNIANTSGGSTTIN